MKFSEISGLNKDLPTPLYFQLKESLRKRIATREWKPGKKIPTEAEICEMYGVSRITTRKALDELQSDGYLERKQGKGTFVRNNAIEQKLSKFYSFSEELKKRGMKERADMVSFETVVADEEVAAGLHLALGEPVFRISRVRRADEIPYAHEISYIPAALAKGLTEEMVDTGGLYRSLAKLGISVDNAVEKIRAINLDKKTAALLGVRPNDAATYLVRTAGCGPTTVEYCISVIVGDFFSYTVELK